MSWGEDYLKDLEDISMDNPAFPPDYDYIKEMFNKYEAEYEILENDETIEVE